MADYILGDLLFRQGKFEEAEPLVNQSLITQTLLYGEGNPVLASTIDTLALIQQGQGKMAAAEQSSRKALSITEKALGSDNINTVYYHSALADLLLKGKNYSDAEQHVRTAMSILVSTKSTDHQYMASAEYILADVLYSSGRSQQAEPLLRKNIERWQQNKAPAWRAARSENLLGSVLLKLNRESEGKALLQSSYRTLQTKNSGVSPQIIADARMRLVQAGLLQ